MHTKVIGTISVVITDTSYSYYFYRFRSESASGESITYCDMINLLIPQKHFHRNINNPALENLARGGYVNIYDHKSDDYVVRFDG